MHSDSETLDLDGIKARYDPEVQRVGELLGLSQGAARKGEKVHVLQRGFFSSYDDEHRQCFAQVLGQFPNADRRPDNLLVVIRGVEARIHKKFPLSLRVRPKVPIKAHHFVFQDQILDIEEVRFRDSIFEVDIRDEDKIVWFFRLDWSFGLYFDFSGKLTIAELWKTLGDCYRAMYFHTIYSFFADPANPTRLMDRGWFPFIQFSTEEFRQLRHGVENPPQLPIVEEFILGAFTEERIDRIANAWWANEAYREKKEIILAGLSAYKDGSDAQIINCIKNLISEMEGIVRLHFDRNVGGQMTTARLIEYVSNRGKASFPSSGSLAFPELFHKYLETFIFRAFSLDDRSNLSLSRHSVTHGVATADLYTRVRALQVVLSLDQIHHYMMSRKTQGDPPYETI